MTSIQPKESFLAPGTWPPGTRSKATENTTVTPRWPKPVSSPPITSFRKSSPRTCVVSSADLPNGWQPARSSCRTVGSWLGRAAEWLAADSVELPDGWQPARPICRTVGSPLRGDLRRLAADSAELPDGWQLARSSCRMVGSQLSRSAVLWAGSSVHLPGGWQPPRTACRTLGRSKKCGNQPSVLLLGRVCCHGIQRRSCGSIRVRKRERSRLRWVRC